MARRRAIHISAAIICLLTVTFDVDATPIMTDAGRPVANTNIVVSPTAPPKLVHEDGTRVDRETMAPPPLTDAQKAAIIARARAAHPSIPATGNSDPTVAYDCHGLTFKSGNLFIDDPEVDKILTDQNWRKRASPEKAQVGDIVIYRNPDKPTVTPRM
jgi:hypothetical protein